MNDLFSADRRNLPRVIPERIREAREARGLQIEAFAELLDITKQAVSRLESGLSAPSGETFGRIIAVTRQPPAFFTTPRQRAADGILPFWRSLKRVELHHRKRIARRLEWASDVVAYLERFIDLPTIDLPSLDFEPASQSIEQIEAAADALRSAWSLGRGPIRDLSAIMELHGFILIHEAVDCADMDAVSCWQSGRPYVLFSSDVTSGPRTAYNLAHELGHMLLHSSVAVTSDNINEIERQANRFASALLLPQDTFSREVLGTSLSHFEFLKQKWGVSIAAMAYRCKDLELINVNQHGYIMRQLNMKRIRNHEPLDELFQTREPTILESSIKMLLDHGVQTKDQLEEALALSLGDIERLCGLPKGHLDTRVVPFTPRLRNSN
ncbi:helix-turn-helix domain-containing protein [Mesorhizobium captivum]|uniref:helix-turn-helix domain-containing protein n=1 Tax=Mesorhizobium captivum TaxID=3072319 RepID=UPI002A242EF8|nr:XRE family transcriptional regulator [Mesorhizobium sp. VK22E]MDX8508608.1 XRE family transcriptional regulator [Mesorhizobium sp. VK22E]